MFHTIPLWENLLGRSSRDEFVVNRPHGVRCTAHARSFSALQAVLWQILRGSCFPGANLCRASSKDDGAATTTFVTRFQLPRNESLAEPGSRLPRSAPFLHSKDQQVRSPLIDLGKSSCIWCRSNKSEVFRSNGEEAPYFQTRRCRASENLRPANANNLLIKWFTEVCVSSSLQPKGLCGTHRFQVPGSWSSSHPAAWMKIRQQCIELDGRYSCED